MARFPRTIGDILAGQANAGRDLGTSVLGTPELAPIGMEHLDEALRENVEIVNADMALVKDTMNALDAAQAGAVADLVQLDADLLALDGRLVDLNAALALQSEAQVALDAELEENKAKQLLLDAELVANKARQLELDAELEANRLAQIELDATLTANKQAVDADLAQLSSDLAANDAALAEVPGNITAAINDAAAIPLTDERFQESSLTIWPFVNAAIPRGAFDAGSITGPDLADFAITVKKFKDDRHRIY